MPKKVAIGIDLGTTNTCVAVFQNGKVDIIANDIGSRTTPSCVAFTQDEILVGNSAKDQALVNSNNTIFEAKRLIGRRFTDVTVQQDMKQWPYEVIDDHGAPKFKVQSKSDVKIFTPEQISAMVLQKVKEVAQDFIGQEVQDAVITVPAYFNDSQRQATLDAGKIAGLKVNIINEPTAAALAYGFDKKIIQRKNVLVFDLGGGTFDVAILSIADKDYEVKAVGGDTHLGGGDFDSKLVEHFLAVIKRKHGKDLSGNHRALGRLRWACEVAKVKLSTTLKTMVPIDCLFDGKDFQVSITRKRFEDMCLDLFKKTIELVESVVEDSGINKEEIQEVILVGGSSRIPKIQELLSKFFDGKKLNATINPDEAVAYGAAVKAALASGDHTIEEIKLADVVPLSLGLRDCKGKMQTFIKRNAKIPVIVVQPRWTTPEDDTRRIKISVYEGERERASSNHLLGDFKFDIGERQKAGVPKICFTFEVDVNGILHVSGVNKNTNSTAGITITSNKGRLNKEEIERMVQEAKACSALKQSSQDTGDAKEALESYCLDQKGAAAIKWDVAELSEAEYDFVVRLCDQAVEWLDDNDGLDKESYVEKLNELREKCSSVMDKTRLAALTFNSFLF